MINKIVSGISNKLFYTFGIDYTIYTENVEQGFNEPCFYISVVDYIYDKEISNNRYRREKESLIIDVILFLKEDEQIHKKINDMIKPLIYTLECISLDDKKLICNDIEIKIVDNVLHVILCYNLNTIFKFKKDLMKNLEQKGHNLK